jgi:membrane-associated phospholipid phosphatase
MDDRIRVLHGDLTAVQTVAAFPSLHVGIAVTMCLMLELLRLPRLLRLFMWVFLGLTVLATIYLGWHYFVDALSGAVLGVAAVWIAARGTGNPFRRIEPEPEPERVPVSAGSRAA